MPLLLAGATSCCVGVTHMAMQHAHCRVHLHLLRYCAVLVRQNAALPHECHSQCACVFLC